MAEALPVVFTVGHSTRALEEFARLLEAHTIACVADVPLVRGVAVEHILSESQRKPHTLTPWARVNGWAAVKQLKGEGIRTNVTLCLSANQSLFAALAGAYIISPFVGRQAAKHPLTDQGIEHFPQDWQQFTEETGGEHA